MIPTKTQLLLARLRANGSVPAPELAGLDTTDALASLGRRLVRTGDVVVWGWADGHEPDPEGPEVQAVTGFAALVLAVLMGLAWPDVSEDPWPGQPIPDAAHRIAAVLDRDYKVVQKFLGQLRVAGLIEEDEERTVRLGPVVASWTPRTITALRRHHHLLASPLKDER